MHNFTFERDTLVYINAGVDARSGRRRADAQPGESLTLLVALDATQLLLYASLFPLHLLLLRLVQRSKLPDELVVLGGADLDVGVDDLRLADDFNARELSALRVAEGANDFQHTTFKTI